MKDFIFYFLLILFFNSFLKSEIKKQKFDNDQCFACHEQLGGIADLFKKDIHYQKGISCSACHGGDNTTDDMEKAMNKNAGYAGIPKGDEISKRCSKCHDNKETLKKFGSNISTNQFEMLSKSVHGKLAINGKEKIVQCTTCHNSHGIVSVKNISSPVNPVNIPKTCSKCHSNSNYIRAYNPALAVDQLDKYRSSIHGIKNLNGDNKVAECSSCHGSHNILSVNDVRSTVYPLNLPKTCSHCHSDKNYMGKYKIPTNQFEKFSKSVHGKALLEKHDINAPACNDCHGNHSATPPGVESISKVCGSCHNINADLFSSSPHKIIFDKEKLPECETCHGNHEIISATNELLGITKEAVCSKCHEENKNKKGYSSAKEMRRLVDKLEQSEKFAKMLINEAEQKGMEISEIKFKIREAHQAKLEARTMVHSFDVDKFKEIIIGKGLSVTDFVKGEAQKAIDDFYFRRYGLVVSIIIICFLSLILFLYIKKLERKS